MKIQIWSDFTCPFCYIAKANLDQALAQLGLDQSLDLEYKSFQLHPDLDSAKYQTYLNFLDHLGWDDEKIKDFSQQIAVLGQSAQVNIEIDKLPAVNTLDAHRLYQYAKEQGKGLAYFTSLSQAYFEDQADLSDHNVLINLASNLDLDQDELSLILADKSAYTGQVNQDIFQAGAIGVEGVPFMALAGKYAIPGLQSAEIYSQAIQQISQAE
ncbi:hypothetical protein AWM75_04950 [Aerococcus urinaehominis]|uniref:Uncharacterized protein n=1 Tax=Aerococcus urinaehominis TaxID=128944 RepID=A0A0X8FL75_9LACT|nr:DsbA family oxidoreductase [Aerococcus urinaehominis]AMB99378.1 hypothetical protein AWM75_04950 [Aerococcus urinaehominis]SDM23035.1 Predicted dithiol-disulfide isomerase, DsbA family [Aerococcus urinaehominis]